MKTITLSADSTMDMPAELIRQIDLRVIASYVTMGDKTVEDWPDISQQDLLGYVKSSGKLAKTSAANPMDYENWFRKLAEEGKPVVHIAKSSGISSCYENACIAAKDLENVYVVDSKNLSGGSSFLIHEATNCGLEDPEALCRHLEEYRERIDGSFIIETLDFLRMGGRCSTVAALGANILRLRPEIVIDDGKMHVGKKYRGVYRKCVYEYLDDKFSDMDRFDTNLVYVNHTIQDPAFLQELLEHVRTRTGCRELIEYPASAAISTHCGPNTFGVFLLRKK